MTENRSVGGSIPPLAQTKPSTYRKTRHPVSHLFPAMLVTCSALFSPDVRQKPRCHRRSPRLTGINADAKPGIFGFKPNSRTSANVPRADALRHDALESHVTGVPEDRVAVSGDRLAELDAITNRVVLPGEQLG